MSAGLSEAELDYLQGELFGHRSALHRQIERELIESEFADAETVMREVQDAGDASVADLVRDLGLSRIQRHAEELDAIERALARIENDSYGICVDTGEPIPFERLKANPTALRTREAQEVYERTHYQQPHPTM